MGKQIVSAAPSGAGIEFGDFIKKLFVIEPLEVEKDVKTVHGVTDAIRANAYVVLSKDGSKFEEFEDTLIFPKVLQGQLRRQIGSIVVGRLEQGEKKAGQNPPWILAEASEGDIAAASAFLAKRSVTSASVPDDEPGAGDGFEDDGDAF